MGSKESGPDHRNQHDHRHHHRIQTVVKSGRTNPWRERERERERERDLTVAFNLGVEGTGHHLWTSSNGIWSTTTRYNSHVVEGIYIISRQAWTDKVTKWLHSLNSTLHNVSGHSTVGIGIDSYPYGSRDQHPNFTTFVERFDIFNHNEKHFGIHLQIRSVVMKRHLASTVASAIRRHFHPVETRPYRHWKGMRLIEEQVRSMSQDQWIMIDYEDFLLRPTEYAPILAKWFRIDNVTAFEMGLGAVKVRSPDRDIVQESWDKIRKWDAEHSNHRGDGFNMEQAVQEVMREWKADKDSIWNNECVVVSPENAAFIEEGVECF